jgi:hypothetical protein
MAHDGDEYVEMQPSGLFSEELCRRAVEEFGSDGAWLLLSIVSYGWRSYYDLADAIVRATPPPTEPSRPAPIDDDFQIVRDLQVQSFIYSAVEQFAGLVRAARLHEPGSSAFFDAYVQHKNVGALVQAIGDLAFDELSNLVGRPLSESDLSPVSEAQKREGPILLEHLILDATDVGGILVPRSAITSMARREMLDRSRELVELILTNIGQLAALVENPPVVEGAPKPQPLREVDNAFRHGHRVLFHDAVPEQRVFRALGESGEGESHAVDLYMPKGDDALRFATVSASPGRTTDHLEALRQVSLRTGQFARGFLGWRSLGTGGLFAAAVELQLGQA